MQNYTSILGDNWFATFSQFRLNPETFFDKRKLTREAFCLDVLRDVYLDHIDSQCKIHILLLLQEYSTILIKDVNLLEQICGSLINLFNVLKSTNENKFLRSQTLIAVSTILLSSDLDIGTDEAVSIQKLLSTFKQLLLSIIFNRTENSIVISAACKCLEEIEECFPTTLESEMKSIFKSCENQLSPAFQNYATLLSLCMKNICIQSPDKNVPEKGNVEHDYTKDGMQLPNLVSYLIELIPLMTPMSVYRVLKNLIHVVKSSSSISPVVFKLFLPNLIFSSEVPYLNLAFDFLEHFHLDLLTLQEEKCLLRQLMLLSTHPCLSLAHRMLFMDWLKTCILKQGPLSSSFPVLKSLLPGPFDGPITQEKKSCVLTLCVPKNIDKNLGLDFLNELISGLKKCALLPNGSKAAASFFRTLFICFSHHKQELIHNYMYKLLLGIMKTSPHLLQYVLSFLDAVKVKLPESSFPKEALTHMVDHILSLPMKQFTSNLECYLAILEQASEICGYECKPRSILHLLQKLLVDSNSHEGNLWEFGNSILSVCRSILLFHDLQIFYYDLAEVLCLISQSIDDVDVKDRAKIYYTALTTLSKLKIQSVFKMKTPKSDLKNSLKSFVPGVNTNLQYVPCIQVLTKPVLELVRVKKVWTLLDENNATHLSPSIDVLETYKQYVNMNDSVVQLPFLLKHISDSEEIFNSLYGVVISTQSSPPCKEISVIEIPVFKKSRNANEDNVFDINIVPFESRPTELLFKVEFTSSNGQNYVCNPDPVFLNFKDYFLTLPVPQSLKGFDSEWKKKLFEILWEEFEKETSLGLEKIKCCKSATCLKISKEELLVIIEEHWKQFVVAKFDEFNHWIAIFLPPRSHLLMKIDIINDKPFINIMVDDVSILPWTALYLQEITKC